MRAARYSRAPSGSAGAWAALYAALLLFTVGTIAVFHMVPSHDKGEANKALNILLSGGGGVDFPIDSHPAAAVWATSPPTVAPTVAPSAASTYTIPSGYSLRGAAGGVSSGASVALPGSSPSLGLETVLLVIASNRPEYLRKCLSFVQRYHPRQAVPVIISQDGDRPAVNEVVEKFEENFLAAAQVPFQHLHHHGQGHYENGYFALADHFQWALEQAFSNPLVRHVIILEEDLQIAPDFFEFFAASRQLLEADSSLMAASAWNDNGFTHAVKDNKQLYRSDFFPGLGWMLPRRIWEELAPKWPRAYWDDWLREPKQRAGRHFIRPEVCRSLHYGQRGVSNAQYGEFLTTIRLNDEFVPFTSLDLSYLLQPKWDAQYLGAVKSARAVSARAVEALRDRGAAEVRVSYTSLPDFETVARQLGVMDNIKAGVPRTAYQGVVSFWAGDVKVHIAPQSL